MKRLLKHKVKIIGHPAGIIIEFEKFSVVATKYGKKTGDTAWKVYVDTVCTLLPPLRLSAGGGFNLEPPTKFSKRGCLTGP